MDNGDEAASLSYEMCHLARMHAALIRVIRTAVGDELRVTIDLEANGERSECPQRSARNSNGDSSLWSPILPSVKKAPTVLVSIAILQYPLSKHFFCSFPA